MAEGSQPNAKQSLRGQVVCLFPLESVKDGRPCLKLKHEKCRRDRIQSVGAEEVWWGSDKFKKWRCDCDKENSSENRLIVWCVNKDDVESILRVDENGEKTYPEGPLGISIQCPLCKRTNIEVRVKLEEKMEEKSSGEDLLGKRKIGDQGSAKTPDSAMMEGMQVIARPERGGGQLSPRSEYSPREITLWVMKMLKQIGDLSIFDEEDGSAEVKKHGDTHGKFKQKSYIRANDRLENMLPGEADVIYEIKKEPNSHQGRKRHFCPALPTNNSSNNWGYRLTVLIWNDQTKEMQYLKGQPSGWGPSVFEVAMECFNYPGYRPERLVHLLDKCSARSKQQLCLAWGVGVKTAQRLFDLGVKNVKNLSEMLLEPDKMDGRVMKLLTRGVPKRIHPIRCFMKRFHELHETVVEDGETMLALRRIPRTETEDTKAYIEETCKDLRLEFVPCGSYRRGKETSGDIDFAVFPDGSDKKKASQSEGEEYDCMVLLKNVMDRLVAKGVVEMMVGCGPDHYWPGSSATRSYQNGGNFAPSAGIMALIKIPGINHFWRRLDMWCQPRCQMPYALMTYTGSAHHNRSLRLYAKLRGYALNNYGLYKRAEVMGDGATMPIGVKYLSSEEGLVHRARECKDEEDVYRLLNIAFVEPKNRNGGIPIQEFRKIGIDVKDTATLEKMHDDLEQEEDEEAEMEMEMEMEMVAEKTFVESDGKGEEEEKKGQGSKRGVVVCYESQEEDEEEVIPDSEDESSERLTQDMCRSSKATQVGRL